MNGMPSHGEAPRRQTCTRKPPSPPVREADPFARERAAAASIARLLLCADPYAKKTARGIMEACKVLQARFGRPDENKETTEE